MQALNQIKQFSLLTIKSIADLYKNLFVVAWPMWFSMAIASLCIVAVRYYLFELQDSTMTLIGLFAMFLIQASVVLVRPSVRKKSMHAIVQNRTYGAFTVPVFMLVLAVVLHQFLFLQPVFSEMFTNPLSFKTLIMLPFHPMHILSFAVFYLFFFLDTDKTTQKIVPSIIRAAKIIVYNFPIYFSFFVFLYYVSVLLFTLLSDVSVATSLLVLLCPIPISVLSNLYITWTRKNYSRYFG